MPNVISIVQVQDLARPRSALTEHAFEFIQQFEFGWKNISKLSKNFLLSQPFLFGNQTTPGFLHELSLCYKTLKLESLSLRVKQLCDSKSQRISLEEFIKDILKLNPEQLKRIAKMHHEVVQTDLGEVPLKEYRGIVSCFDGHEGKSQDRVEAGHLMMMLSQSATQILAVKKIFYAFAPLTLEKIDELLEIETPSRINQYRKDLDDSLETINLLQGALKEHNSDLLDLNAWKVRMSFQKRSILKRMLHDSNHEGLSGNSRMLSAMRAFKAWSEWRLLCRFDKEAERMSKEASFSKSYQQVHHKLIAFSEQFLTLLEAMESMLNEGISGISLYCNDLLMELRSVYATLLGLDHLDLSFRKLAQRVQSKLNLMYQKIKNHLDAELDELKELPESFQRRLLFLSYEVPRVLFRGNPKEIKNMALVVSYNYRLAKILMKKSAFQNLTEQKKDRITHLLQSKTTRIVKKASLLVKKMTPLQVHGV